MPYNGLLSTAALVCDPTLDGPSTALDFNVFAGQSPWIPQTDSKIPTASLGTSDLSIEVIARKSHLTENQNDVSYYTGLLLDGVGIGFPVAALRWDQGTDDEMTVRFDANGDGVGLIQIPGNVAPSADEWNYWCVNFDRDGLATVFPGGVSGNSTSIAAQSAISIDAGVYPLISDEPSIAEHDNDSDDVSSINVNPYMVAQVAMHSRLLTQPEITAAASALGVNAISETFVSWDWLNIQKTGGGAVSLNTAKNLMVLTVQRNITVADLNDNLTAIEEADGTVFAPDISGNSRNWQFATFTPYIDGVPNRATCAITKGAIP